MVFSTFDFSAFGCKMFYGLYAMPARLHAISAWTWRARRARGVAGGLVPWAEGLEEVSAPAKWKRRLEDALKVTLKVGLKCS